VEAYVLGRPEHDLLASAYVERGWVRVELAQPLREVREETGAVVGANEHDVEQAVTRVCVWCERKVRPHLADVHDLDREVLAGEVLPVRLYVPSAGGPVFDRVAQELEAEVDLLLAFDVDSADLLDPVGAHHHSAEQAAAERLDELSAAPTRGGLPHVEPPRLAVAPAADDPLDVGVVDPERAREVVGRPERQEGYGYLFGGKLPEDLAHGAVAASHHHEIAGLGELLQPAWLRHGDVRDVVACLGDAGAERLAGVVVLAGVRIVDQRHAHDRGGEPVRILVSNDDGVYSPGIAALARAAQRFGEVRVVAPDVEQSSAGHAITSSRPLRYRRTAILDDIEAYRVNGTPADCVALGLFMWEGVDVVLSGINLGPNLGNATWHSGTLAAAKQAVLLGVRGIALSTPVDDDQQDFSTIAPWVDRVLEVVLDEGCPRLVNVNFPREPRGMRWTAQAVDRYDGTVVPDEDPMGRTHYWFTVVPLEKHREDTDLWAVERGYVSLTPLRLDLTHIAELERMRDRHALDQERPGDAEVA
jgi:5'/3'-nucleotidase